MLVKVAFFSPYLFSRYVTDMIGAVADAGVGCKVANHVVNSLEELHSLNRTFLSVVKLIK